MNSKAVKVHITTEELSTFLFSQFLTYFFLLWHNTKELLFVNLKVTILHQYIALIKYNNKVLTCMQVLV